MDPLSIAGLAVGSASLALQLFAGCVRGYQLLVDMEKMPENYEYLRIRLKIEQARFLEWGDKIGLIDELLEKPNLGAQVRHGHVITALSEIQRLLSRCVRLETKFDRSKNPTAIHDEDVHDKSSTSHNQPAPDRQSSVLLRKTLGFLDQALQVPRRLSWAMINHEAFEKLVHDLISFNNSILSLLDRSTIQNLQDLQLQNQLISLQLCSKVDELKRLSLAMGYGMSIASPAQTPGGVLILPNTTMTTDSQATDIVLASLASFKAQRTSLESNPALANVKLTSINDIKLLDDTNQRSQAIYRDKHVWLEWKMVDHDARTPEKLALIEERIRRLTMLLGSSTKPALFRAPDCVGFCRQIDGAHSRYGLIFQQPAEYSSTNQPLSLLAILKGKHKISLTHRIRLAHSIAQSLMYLHSVNWLHKGLRSDNIIFLASSGVEPDLVSPIITGFEYARPDHSDEETDKPRGSFEHNIYRHPDVLGAHNPRSHKSHDIYSLGVVLIEIAVWNPVQKVVTDVGTTVSLRTPISTFRKALLDRQLLATVEMYAGQTYRRVVETCLLGGASIGIPPHADESDLAIGAAMLSAFLERIVAPLNNICV